MVTARNGISEAVVRQALEPRLERLENSINVPETH